jgi:hypothetical protein
VLAASGLCATCAHVRVVPSKRGSEFVLCRRSEDDPRYARYPPLPVLDCPGYRRAEGVERPGGSR